MGRVKDFFEACKTGNIAVVVDFIAAQKQKNVLLQKFAGNLDCAEDGKRTGLLLASRHNHLICVKALVDAGANLYARDESSCTVLHYAVWNSNLEMTAFLLTEDARQKSMLASIGNGDTMTPLHVACQQNMPEIVGCLLRFNARPLEANAAGRTPFDLACSGGHADTVAALLPACKARISTSVSFPTCSPLEEASRGGYARVVQALLEAGFRANARCGTSDTATALHAACVGLRHPVVELLLAAGADPLERDSAGRTVPEMLEALGSPEHRRLAEHLACKADISASATAASVDEARRRRVASSMGAPPPRPPPPRSMLVASVMLTPSSQQSQPLEQNDSKEEDESPGNQSQDEAAPKPAPRRSQQSQQPPPVAKRRSTVASPQPPSPKPRHRATVMVMSGPQEAGRQLPPQQPPPRPPPPPLHHIRQRQPDLLISIEEQLSLQPCVSDSALADHSLIADFAAADASSVVAPSSEPLLLMDFDSLTVTTGKSEAAKKGITSWEPVAIVIDKAADPVTNQDSKDTQEEFQLIGNEPAREIWQPISKQANQDNSPIAKEQPPNQNTQPITEEQLANQDSQPIAVEPATQDSQKITEEQAANQNSQPIIVEQPPNQDSQTNSEEQPANQNSQPIAANFIPAVWQPIGIAQGGSQPFADDEPANELDPQPAASVQEAWQPITIEPEAGPIAEQPIRDDLGWEPIAIEESITGGPGPAAAVLLDLPDGSKLVQPEEWRPISLLAGNCMPRAAGDSNSRSPRPVTTNDGRAAAAAAIERGFVEETGRLGPEIWPEPLRISESVFYLK